MSYLCIENKEELNYYGYNSFFREGIYYFAEWRFGPVEGFGKEDGMDDEASTQKWH